MTKNILLTVVGAVLGFMLGFLVANSFSKALTPPPGTVADTSSRATPAAAPPLDPAQTSGKLPPNHPNISGDTATGDAATNGTTTGAANITANSAQAQSAMDQADRQPRSFDAQMSAAAVFYQAGAFDKAALYLSRALAINPNNADALTAMGDTKYDAGDYAGAASFYERSLAQRPSDVDVRTDLGNTYFQRSPPDFDRAIAEYRKALQLDPKHEKTLQNLAAAALRKGDKQTARDAVEKLASVNPSNQFATRMRAALENNSTP